MIGRPKLRPIRYHLTKLIKIKHDVTYYVVKEDPLVLRRKQPMIASVMTYFLEHNNNIHPILNPRNMQIKCQNVESPTKSLYDQIERLFPWGIPLMKLLNRGSRHDSSENIRRKNVSFKSKNKVFSLV